MTGTSQGIARPEPAATLPQHHTTDTSRIDGNSASPAHSTAADDEWNRAVREATENVARIETLNSTSNQRGNSWALPVETGTYARTPIWSGRAQWQHQVRTLLNSPTGTQLCKTNAVSTETAFAVAVTHASFAEGKTGRGITASRETIAASAGVSITAVKRARRVLAVLGVATELVRGRYLRKIESMAAEAHHGHRQFRAASVWALTSPRSVVTATTAPAKKRERSSRATLRTAAHRARTATQLSPQSDARGPLSPSGGFVLQSLVRKFSPTRAQAHAGKIIHPTTTTPRPIELQRAAGQLVAHAPALKTAGHIGAICDILEQAGIDTTQWTGRDIARELTKDTQTRGWVWPAHLTRPAAFLRWKLLQIDFSKPSPAEYACENDRARLAEQAARRRQACERDAQIADAATRTSIVQRSRDQFSRTCA
ncbi:hypothetical protein [Rhodococcus sp. IEGM 1379]|uniref:hypothetical protein n=1 Tax=Rhodococcus sp. IEGM 1379 TaxID=3047086 RepID=UPI0024B7646C|nr:hypothetical protein [Rhodococcus sp. IEGM 1379]MDI9915384.1 hypothetical protein [Rhodococcus sp. IEGM 1379]